MSKMSKEQIELARLLAARPEFLWRAGMKGLRTGEDEPFVVVREGEEPGGIPDLLDWGVCGHLQKWIVELCGNVSVSFDGSRAKVMWLNFSDSGCGEANRIFASSVGEALASSVLVVLQDIKGETTEAN